MCGIIGFFSSDTPQAQTDMINHGLPAIREGIKRMADRGPDDNGIYSKHGVALGHTRLSIIDLAGGKQPFTDEATGVTLVFNGEIFNYREIRDTLRAKGHIFSTNSDTEVLLKAYVHWNTDCLQHLSGMYAFAIFDPRSGNIFLARDRLGIKPLFYSIFNDKIMFASTCDALLCFNDVSKKADPAALSHYLTTIRTTLGRQTLFRDIKSLMPGEYICAGPDHQTPVIRRYWDIPVTAESDKARPGLPNAAAKVQELLHKSVKQQLISDVPLGGFLSGGIDSSVLTSLATGMSSDRYGAYSIGFDRDGYNEWPYIREAVDHFGINCKEIRADKNSYPETWSHLIGSKGLPLSTPNEICIYQLAKALRNDFTVALTGEGADEIFGGYTIPYFSAFDYDRARHSAPESSELLSPLDRSFQRLYRRPHLMCRPDHYFLVNSWFPLEYKRNILTNNFWTHIRADDDMFSHYENYFEKFETCTTFDSYMQIHARINMEGLLSRVDSCTMAASVEARVPFVDHELTEYLFSLPDSYKIDWISPEAQKEAEQLNIAEIDKKGLIRSKILLREAFGSDVPQSIATRPKASFPVPFREWFGEEWMLNFVQDTIMSSPMMNTIFNSNAVEKNIQASTQPIPSMILWPLTNLCLWQQKYSVDISF